MPAGDLEVHGAQLDRNPHRVGDLPEVWLAARRTAHGGDVPRSDQRHRLAEGRESFGALVELGARPPEGQEHLGRDDEHRERRREADRSVEEPQPEGDRQERDGDRRQRVEDERREEGGAQGRQARLPQRLPGGLDAAALLGGAVEGPQDREPLEDVRDVAPEALDLSPAVSGEREAGASDERAEDREEHDGGDDDDAGDPVEHADGDRQRDRRHDGEDEVRQAPPDVDVEGVEPAPRHRREVSWAAGAAGRGARERGPDEPRAQVGLGPRRTEMGQCLPGEGREAPHRGRCPESDEGAEAVAGVGAGHRAGEEVRQRDGLYDDGGRRDEPDCGRGGDGVSDDGQLRDEPPVGAGCRRPGSPACAEAAGHG